MTGVSGVMYNGTDLRTLGLYTNGNKVFSSPEKNYTKISIPGRSGDLYIWDGTYKNIKVSYSSIILPTPIFNSTSFESKFRQNVTAIKTALLSANDYVKIEDTYNPNEFRLGVFEGPLDIDATLLSAGKATLTFNCRPERFIIDPSQYEVRECTEAASSIYKFDYKITNTTGFESKPIFILPTYNTKWNRLSFEFYNDPDMRGESFVPDLMHPLSRFRVELPETPANAVVIDCEKQDCYLTNYNFDSRNPADLISTWRSNNYINWNSNIEFYFDTDFPTIKYGDTYIKIDTYTESDKVMHVNYRGYYL